VASAGRLVWVLVSSPTETHPWLIDQTCTSQPRPRGRAPRHGRRTRRARWRCCMPCPASTGALAAPRGSTPWAGRSRSWRAPVSPPASRWASVLASSRSREDCWRWPWSARGAVRSPVGCWLAPLGPPAWCLTAYGGLLVAVGALVLTGLISPSGPVDRTALRWHVLLWDVWFLVWGLVLGVAAWHFGRESRSRGAR
jgi:hypothetical protein